MIVSVHLPKTAGASFLKALDSVFGKGLLKDYSGMSCIQEYLSGNGDLQRLLALDDINIDFAQCIHGHFLPLKYIALANNSDVKFITWVREPVERLLSHYYYWKRSYDPKIAGPLFKRVIEENWSLERFCFSEELRNIYGKYLTGFPVGRFDFIGVAEFYEDDLAYFSDRVLGRRLAVHKENVRENVGARYEIDVALRKEIEEFHGEDIKLYQSALSIRSNRQRKNVC